MVDATGFFEVRGHGKEIRRCNCRCAGGGSEPHFQYAIPEKYQRSLEIAIGCWFPLAVDGWKAMVELSDQLEVEAERLRSIIKPLDAKPAILPSLGTSTLDGGYLCRAVFRSPAVHTALPTATAGNGWRVNRTDGHPSSARTPAAQKRLGPKSGLWKLSGPGQMLAAELLALTETTNSTLQALARRGLSPWRQCG